MDPGRGFSRTVTPPAVTLQPRTPSRVAPVQTNSYAARGAQRPPSVTVAPRPDKARAGSESRGFVDRSAPAISRGSTGPNTDRVTTRTPLQRIPERSAANRVPSKGRRDDSLRGGVAFGGDDRVARLSPARRDSYQRWGRDHQWNGDGHRGGHGRYYGRYDNGYRPYPRYGYRSCYGGNGYSYPRHGYRSCYGGYAYSYPRLYHTYPSGYYGASLFYDPYWDGGYGGGYNVVTYDTTPATYTTYNSTVYGTSPVEGYPQTYAAPSSAQGYAPSYQESPSAFSVPEPVQAPTQTYSAPQAEDATLTPPSTVQEAQGSSEPDYKEPEAVREGHQHFGKGEYKDAQAAFLRGVLADGRDAYARLFYGMASVAVGDYSAAAAAVRSALELAPDMIAQPIDLRQFYGDAATMESHVQGLSGWLQSRPGEVEARLTLAYLLFATGNADGADHELSRVEAGSKDEDLVKQLRDSIAQVKADMSRQPSSTGAQPGSAVPAAPAIP